MMEELMDFLGQPVRAISSPGLQLEDLICPDGKGTVSATALIFVLIMFTLISNIQWQCELMIDKPRKSLARKCSCPILILMLEMFRNSNFLIMKSFLPPRVNSAFALACSRDRSSSSWSRGGSGWLNSWTLNSLGPEDGDLTNNAALVCFSTQII